MEYKEIDFCQNSFGSSFNVCYWILKSMTSINDNKIAKADNKRKSIEDWIDEYLLQDKNAQNKEKSMTSINEKDIIAKTDNKTKSFENWIDED